MNGVDLSKGSWAIYEIDPQIELIKEFLVEALRKEDFISAIIVRLPHDINSVQYPELDKKIGQLFDGLFADYSHIWFKSLASAWDEHASGAEGVLTMILLNTLLAKCKAKPEEGKMILSQFLTNEYPFPIFKRFLKREDKFFIKIIDILLV